MRRLPLLLLLAVLPPVPAQADRHTVECFGGFTPEKQQALSLRVSCGFLALPTPGMLSDQDVPQTVPVGMNDTTRSSAAMGMWVEPETGHGGTRSKVKKGSLVVVVEAAEYVAGRDSGHSLDAWMLGFRYLFRGQSSIEPFVHALGGRQRPSRENDLRADDAATDWATVAAVGGGFDIEVIPDIPGAKKPVIVPVLRLQLDVVESWATDGFHPYARATFGVSLRFEKPHK